MPLKKPSEVNDVNWLVEWNPEVSKKCNYPSGQWKLNCQKDNLDSKWESAVTMYRSGQLPGIHTMKASTGKNAQDKSIVFYSDSSCPPQFGNKSNFSYSKS